MTESTELIELPSKDTALATFTTPGGLDHYVEQVREKVSGTVYDMKIRKDREACAADAYKVTRTKTAVEKMGAALSAKYKEVPKQIDAQRRDWNAKMDSLRDEVRKPLTEWEEAEANRIAMHRNGLESMASQAREVGALNSDALRLRIKSVEAEVIGESWEEFEAEAHRVKAKALEILSAALSERQRYEAEQAELAELRRKQAEQEQKDREADIAHKASINNAALAAFIENGMPDECAKQAVILIAKGLIPAIRIQY